MSKNRFGKFWNFDPWWPQFWPEPKNDWNDFEMIFRELSNAAFRFSLRRPGAEIMGGGGGVQTPPPSRRWKIQRPSRARGTLLWTSWTKFIVTGNRVVFYWKEGLSSSKNIWPYSFQQETRWYHWFVGPLQNYNEIFIPKSSSDDADLNRFWVRRNVYGFRQKREINDFQMEITDDLEWNFEKCLNRFNSMGSLYKISNFVKSWDFPLTFALVGVGSFCPPPPVVFREYIENEGEQRNQTWHTFSLINFSSTVKKIVWVTSGQVTRSNHVT